MEYMEQSAFRSVWGILIMTALLLLLYPCLHRQTDVLSQHFRDYNFFQRFLLDSTELAALDTLAQQDTLAIPPNTISLPPPPPPPPSYAGKAGLETFYDALRAGKGQVRIAYFGDSAIEGDLICQTLRDSLQNRFGGSGVGLVPISSPIRGFRRSVRHNTSTNWYRRMLGQKNWPGYPLGILGGYFLAGKPPQPEDTVGVYVDSTFLPKDSLLIVEDAEEGPNDDEEFWVTYRGVNLFSGLRMIPRSRLFYSAPIPDSSGQSAQAGSLKVASGDWNAKYDLNGKETVNQVWLSDSTVRQLSLTFEAPYSQPLFGISLESSSGVIVDNIPSRGNSGGRLAQVPYYRYNHFDSLLDYELIILQFGLNALAPELEDFSWYKNEINRTVRHIKQSFPNASILLIGPTDRGIKEEAEVVTDPSVPLVTEVMRQVAERHQIGFFSFYEAMGGSGTIIDWADNKEPRWANLDYTHLSFPGAHAAGKLLLQYLLRDYDQQQ